MQRIMVPDAAAAAEHAAVELVKTLADIVEMRGRASWVLAGGSSPMAAYQILADRYGDAIDWSKVTVLIGDERCVSLEHPDSNWGQIARVLLSNESIARCQQLVPKADVGAEAASEDYSQQIHHHLVDDQGELSIDVLWLGIGEDGHTLSLFPENTALDDDSDYVIPIHDSPKPPSDRITLSVSSAASAQHIVIFATGEGKQAAVTQVEKDPLSLPIGLVAERALDAGADVTWLIAT